MQIHAVELCLSGQPQSSCCIDQEHDRHRDSKRSQRNARTTDELSLKQLDSSSVQESLKRGGIVRGDRTGGSVLTAGKQAKRYGPPNAADTMDRHCSNGIIDS